VADKQKAVLIVNTQSRRGQEWFVQTRTTLQAQGMELLAHYPVRNASRVPQLTRQAIEQRVPLVIVGGGDGTLSAVVRYFVNSDSILGVMPLGTGNQFARDLGIPANIDEACRVLTEGREARVDLGIAGNDYFLNVTTIGLTTLIAESLTVEAKRRLGRFAYAAAVIKAMRQMRRFQATITTDEGTQTIETVQIVIGNGRFHAGPFPLSPDATITDGTLVVYALTASTRWEFLQFVLSLPGGRHVALPTVPTFNTTGGKIETAPVQNVIVDGELMFRTPIQFGLAPGALRVMVPQNFAG
jgi:diacylglycerol kinase (ATP)